MTLYRCQRIVLPFLLSLVAARPASATVVRWNLLGGGPGPREFAAMAYGGGKIVVFGGRDGATVLGDTLLWDGTTWKPVAVGDPAAPPARFGAAMAFEPATQTFLL